MLEEPEKPEPSYLLGLMLIASPRWSFFHWVWLLLVVAGWSQKMLPIRGTWIRFLGLGDRAYLVDEAHHSPGFLGGK